MDRYTRVEKPKPESPINENEIRITSGGPLRNYISYGTSLLQEKHVKEIVLKAMGQAISKTVSVAEGIKRRNPRLHQDTAISSVSITDVWEPLEEGLVPYQAPHSMKQPKQHDQQQQQQQQQQPRQARGSYNAGPEDSYGRGDSYVRGRGRGRGRNWGRGGYGYGNYQGNYQGSYRGNYHGNYQGNYQDNGGYSNQGRGGGRGRNWGYRGTGYERGRGGGGRGYGQGRGRMANRSRGGGGGGGGGSGNGNQA